MINAMLCRVLFVVAFALMLTTPVQAQTQVTLPEIYQMQNRPAPQQTPSGQIPSDSRFVLSDDYKTCAKDTDCMPFATTCDSGTSRCCEYEAVNRLRENDVKTIKKQMCSTSAVHPLACTICEPESSQHATCKEHKCVYVMQLAPPQ